MNTKHLRRIVALACLILGASAAAAQESWIGRQVMPRDGAELKLGDQVISSDAVDLPMTVERVQGDWLWVGRGWINLRRVVPLENAEAYYTDYLRSDRTDPWSWNMRAIVRAETDNYQGALRDYNEAIRLDPSAGVYYLNRADIRGILGDYAGQRSDLDAAVRAEPNNALIHYWCAGDLYDLTYDLGGTPEEYDEIIQHYTTALRLDPSLKEVYGERAYVYWDKGELRLAADDLNEAIRAFPEELDYCRNRADLRWEMGDYRGAIAEWEYVLHRAPASDPDYVDYDDLAWALATCSDASLRNGPRAVQLATKACELTNWKTWDPLDSLAAANAENGDFASAVKWQLETIAKAPADDADLRVDLQERLDLYKQGKPYHQSDSSGDATPQNQSNVT